jgi:hypothetical protein
VLQHPGVLIVGSEVPNLLQPDAASTLVVSQDVDLAVAVDQLQSIKPLLRQVRDLVPSVEEPSVFVPKSPELIEAKLLGLDPAVRDPRAHTFRSHPECVLFVDEARLSMVASREPIPVELGPPLLGATAIALVAFDGIR